MRRHLLVPVALASVVVLAACGGGSSKASPATKATQQGQPASVTYEPAGPNPSASAKMVCQQEAQDDIAAALGARATRVTTPTWSDHIYSCTYVYPQGSIAVSVKELVSAETTTAYFNGLATKFGKAQNLTGLGQGAFIAKNGDTVARKDYKVLLVDMKGVSKPFPAMTNSDVSTNFVVAIMGCWVGA